MCMGGEWATKCTNAACALAVLLMVSNAVSTCSPSCLLSFGPSDGGHVRLSVSLCLGGDTRSPARLRTPLWLLVRKVAAAHVARMGDPCISKKSLNFENSRVLKVQRFFADVGSLPDLVAHFVEGQGDPPQTMVQEHMHKD